MSESSLSELSERDFTSTPQRAAKHTLSSSSPISERPSKKIKLVYRKPSQTIPSSHYRPPQHLSSSPFQPAPNPETVLISRLELQHLRENNGFLRRSNIELAKAHAQGKAQVGAIQEQVKNAMEDTSEAQLQVERLKKESELLTTMTKEGFDPAAASKGMVALEEIRKVYWECGVEWARKENAWATEKELFKTEVGNLVDKVRALERELAEERAKVRGFEGENLEREREMSMRRGMMGGGHYGQQMLENGIQFPDNGDMQMHGGGMMASERGGSHVMDQSWQMQQSPGREQSHSQMQHNGQQQWQGMQVMRHGQGQGYEMLMGAQALHDLGRGQARVHGQERQRMLPMLTMQEQFEAEQQGHDTKAMSSPGQFDGLAHGDEDFTGMLMGPATNGHGHSGLLRNGGGPVQEWELQAMMAAPSGELKYDDNDMEDWAAPEGEDGAYDPENEEGEMEVSDKGEGEVALRWNIAALAACARNAPP